MALGISNGGGGDRVPVIKFNAKGGRIFRVDREQDAASNWSSDEVDVTDGFQAVFDVANIQVGWAHFSAGGAPSFSWVKLGEKLPERPSPDHKQGFRLEMKLGKASGGDVREMIATAQTVIGSVDALHDAYTAGLKSNPGKLPVVALKSVKAVTSKHGKNYEPTWEITRWVDRPPELGGEPVAANEPTPAPVRTTSQVAAVPAADDDEGF